METALNKAFSELKMQKSGLSQDQLDRLRSKVELQAISLDDTGKEADSNALATSGMAYVLALAIYLFIFIYGVQIMRGVGEEKSSRIMEVMLSSVKPFELMMGKILGIAAVGLTQFLLWGILSFGVVAAGALNGEIRREQRQDRNDHGARERKCSRRWPADVERKV
ncbi:ABC transporter permease [Hymenobacter humi]|uniref:ABC transporter permease n=1 Tax=Hymenobacter humi TaxID=1411620 RepID=A0ABW2U958_9BACT